MTFNDNILDQRNPQATLQSLEELQLTKVLMECVSDAIFWVAPDARLLYVNNVACRLVGYSQEELLSMTMHDVYPDFSAKAWSGLWQTIKQQGSLTCESLHRTKEGWSFPVETIGCRRVDQLCGSAFPQNPELKILTKSGEERWLDWSCKVFEFEGKQALLVTAIDITRHRQAELEIRATLEQEKELSEQRARFASIVSHEFRTPLNIISFSTSLLRDQNYQWTEEKKLQYLDRIQIGVEQLNHLLEQVLIISRAGAGKLTFEPRALDLDQFCRNLVAEIQLSDSSSQHTFTWESLGDCSKAYVDEKLLQPILTNLLDNAIKYSPLGSTVNLAFSYQDGEVIFKIKDQGIGIPVADRQQLFEPFHRGKNVGDIPGSGLGLAVVKKLVEIHDGQISVASEVGVGTTFTLTLS